MVETVIFDYMSPHCDLEFENRKPIFLHDTLTDDEASPYQVWLQKIQRFRIYCPDEQSLILWNFTVTSTLNAVIHFFARTLWLMMIYPNSKFGCKRINSSANTVKTVMCWSYETLPWPWPWRCANQSFCMTFRLTMMHHHIKFGASEDIVRTNLHWHFHPSLLPRPSAQ